MKSQVLQVEWIHPNSVERWLRSMALGRTLNVCCGMSRVGEIRLDIEPRSNRTEAGDLFSIRFPPMSFDTVICDPPFAYYRKFRWLRGLKRLARIRVLISAPSLNLSIHFNEFNARLFAISDHTPFLRYYWCFDRKNTILDATLTAEGSEAGVSG
jgi:hypothetical protein